MSDKLIKYKERNHDDPFDYELDDLILRRDAMEAVENEDNLLGAMDSVWDGAFSRTKRAAVRVIAGVSAVKQPMSAREYLETEARMCKHYGLPCAFDVSGLTVDEAIEMVERFSREHPERSEK